MVLSRSRVLVRVVALLALAVSLVLPRPALAAEERDAKAQARAEVSKATLHYKLGRFEEALAAYTCAATSCSSRRRCSSTSRSVTRIFATTIVRSLFFQGYLREETDPKRRALAEDLLAKSRAELQRQRNEPPPSPPLPIPLPAAPVGEEVPKAEPSETARSFRARPGRGTPAPGLLAQEVQAESPPLTRRWWFWTAVGAGVLAIAGGTVAYYASGQTTVVPPTGTVGTLDRR